MNFISAHKSFVIKSKETNCQGQVKNTLWLESPRVPGFLSFLQPGQTFLWPIVTKQQLSTGQWRWWWRASSLPPTVVAGPASPGLPAVTSGHHTASDLESRCDAAHNELGHPRPRACMLVFSQTLYWLSIHSLGCSYLYQVNMQQSVPTEPN